ncbi:hypothetical protein BOX15_Mlig014368g1, partial [Macrostomum lignano]
DAPRAAAGSESADPDGALLTAQLEACDARALQRESEARSRQLEAESVRLAEELAGLQEELVTIKMREAEGSLRLRDLQQQQQQQSSGASSCPQCRELRHRLMQAEAEHQLCAGRLSRAWQGRDRAEQLLAESAEREKALRNELREAERRLAQAEAARREEQVLWRLKETERSADLAQRVARLECEQAEEVAAAKIIGASAASNPSRAGGSSAAAASSANNRLGILRGKWKDLPESIMTDSIGPLEELCFVPDDPLITSIYMGSGSEKASQAPASMSASQISFDMQHQQQSQKH